MSELEAAYKKPIPVDLSPVPSTPSFLTPEAIHAANIPPVVTAPTGANDDWDNVIDATAGHDDDDDDDDDDDEDDAPAAQTEKSAEVATGADKPVPMSMEVARGTAASAFLLMQSGWSILGDRDPKGLEPTDEEMRLLSKVFGSYAERFGWTHELDDAILLGTVLLVYNARASRAPRKKPKLPKGIPQ